MLLREASTAEDDGVKRLPTDAAGGCSSSSSSGGGSGAAVRKFIDAASNTKSLAKPPYIVLTQHTRMKSSETA